MNLGKKKKVSVALASQQVCVKKEESLRRCEVAEVKGQLQLLTDLLCYSLFWTPDSYIL